MTRLKWSQRMQGRLVVYLVSTAVLCPLDVITTKLAVQKNYASPTHTLADQQDKMQVINEELCARYTDIGKDVIVWVSLAATWKRKLILDCV